jgi:hypothetical protein
VQSHAAAALVNFCEEAERSTFLEDIEQKRHQSSIVLIEGGLGRIGNSGNSGQRLLPSRVCSPTLRPLWSTSARRQSVAHWSHTSETFSALLAEVDQSGRSVGLHTRLGRGENGNDVSEDNLVTVAQP